MAQNELTMHSKDANATVQCPVEPGTYKVAQTVELPKEIPKGELTSLYEDLVDSQPNSRWPFEDTTTMTRTCFVSISLSISSVIRLSVNRADIVSSGDLEASKQRLAVNDTSIVVAREWDP